MEIAGSERPAAPVSTLPAKRRPKSGASDAVTVTSYQRRVFFSGTLYVTVAPLATVRRLGPPP